MNRKKLLRGLTVGAVMAAFALGAFIYSGRQDGNVSEASSVKVPDVIGLAQNKFYNNERDLINAGGRYLGSSGKTVTGGKTWGERIYVMTPNIAEKSMNSGFIHPDLIKEGQASFVEYTSAEVAVASAFVAMNNSGKYISSSNSKGIFNACLNSAIEMKSFPRSVIDMSNIFSDRKGYYLYANTDVRQLGSVINNMVKKTGYAYRNSKKLSASYVSGSRYETVIRDYLAKGIPCIGHIKDEYHTRDDNNNFHSVAIAGYGSLNYTVKQRGSSRPESTYYFLVNNGLFESTNGRVGLDSQYQYVLVKDIDMFTVFDIR